MRLFKNTLILDRINYSKSLQNKKIEIIFFNFYDALKFMYVWFMLGCYRKFLYKMFFCFVFYLSKERRMLHFKFRKFCEYFI